MGVLGFVVRGSVREHREQKQIVPSNPKPSMHPVDDELENKRTRTARQAAIDYEHRQDARACAPAMDGEHGSAVSSFALQ